MVEPLRGEEVDGPADADLQDHAAGQHGELLVEEPEEMVAAA